MKSPALAVLFGLTVTGAAKAEDHRADYCIHARLVQKVSQMGMGVDIKQRFKAMFTMEEMKPVIKDCEADRNVKSEIFTNSRREYIYVVVEYFDTPGAETGRMSAIPKYPFLR
jgi:hypothetical protein